MPTLALFSTKGETRNLTPSCTYEGKHTSAVTLLIFSRKKQYKNRICMGNDCEARIHFILKGFGAYNLGGGGLRPIVIPWLFNVLGLLLPYCKNERHTLFVLIQCVCCLIKGVLPYSTRIFGYQQMYCTAILKNQIYFHVLSTNYLNQGFTERCRQHILTDQ
jgi:hypothetical protein